MPPKKSVKPTSEDLLREYEFCQSTAESMEKTIWQTGAAMSLGLVGSFLLVLLRSASDQPAWYLACLAGPLMAIITLIWWLAARRWWSVQHAMFMRMRHIERRIGLHSLSYVQYIDHPDLLEDVDLTDQETSELLDRSTGRNWLGIRRHQHLGVQATLWLLPLVLWIAWWLYALIRLLVQILGDA